MATKNRRSRHRVLAIAAAGAVALLVIVVAFAIVVWLRQPGQLPGPQPSGQPPTSSTSTPGTSKPSKPRPASQSADCPDVQLISIPGTWESSRVLDPLNPTPSFPIALLLNVSNPLGQAFGTDRLAQYTVPYTAQFHNPLAADNQMSYNDSREEGKKKAIDAIAEINNRCPLTSFVIMGFSQGAVIAGDIASDIGNGRGPIDQDLVLGVTLIADGRRQPNVGKDVGPNPPGQGAEITLHELPLDMLGLNMTGPRVGGFGELNDRVNEICGKGDLICAAPTEAFNVINLPSTLATLSGSAAGPVHALYNTPQFWTLNGQTSTQWTLDWAKQLIDNAPHPKHG
ncbi:cutinase family protein [Mycobacterium sp. CBMA293]|uniref:carboxylesterase Culp6 n=1 Tax=unclassified Mycolicibacterium TaxID=2636767 RepID=UPI0012DF38F5|nr:MULTISPECIES: cutinase family protein [unclassified Mycolicibacterium]MUL46588.1 cutinase family protein [Mycolicibacterium sp. CBMA 360]MUL59113.1 cutinase family protein [Mycolicibacterium sp. CBMA 335]MUL69507.1 cutinase family protein [Mycolicibacterium sp. CBMA 311]MUL94471.1 cutinase family protein [Mycolicibacterium sp. CBMA 230]MUM06512.1 cutinase [Mycolicibacterium sp. CBMA 213]